MSLKLRKTKRGEERQQRFDTAKLKNYNTEKAFKHKLKNRFHVLQEEQEMNIDSFNQVLTETSKSLLGYRKNRKEEWIKTDTWKTIDERKETKKKINDTKSQRIKNQLQTRYSTLHGPTNCKRSKISNRQHEVRESARSRRRKYRDAESGRRRHHINPYRDFQGNMGRRRNTRRLEDQTYR